MLCKEDIVLSLARSAGDSPQEKKASPVMSREGLKFTLAAMEDRDSTSVSFLDVRDMPAYARLP